MPREVQALVAQLAHARALHQRVVRLDSSVAQIILFVHNQDMVTGRAEDNPRMLVAGCSALTTRIMTTLNFFCSLLPLS